MADIVMGIAAKTLEAVSSFFASSSSESDLILEPNIFLTLADPKSIVGANLENSLRGAGFTIFIDNQEEEFSAVEETIERCRIIMVIFTPEVVDSSDSRYLKRLVKISTCLEIMKKPVFTVFSGVCRRQIVEDFMLYHFTHYRMEEVETELPGRTLLAEAAWQSGFTLSDLGGDKNEISNLLRILDEYWFPDLANHQHQVGLQLRMREVLALVGWNHLEDMVIVGIWGAGGIGKTTLARAIYDRIGGYFQSRSFLSNINDAWEKDKSLVSVRKQLLSDICERELGEISDDEVPLELMEQMFFTSAVIVLDDVNQENQLKALCGSRKWFGNGCLVFITTRNKDILDHFAHKSYEIKKLDESESLQLLSQHAFKKFSPTNDFENLSTKVIAYCEGLPLVLEVIGSLLHNRTKPEWKQVLNKLTSIPYGQIQEKLKISLDFLTNLEKDLFINIACFYVGQSKDFVTDLSKGSRFLVDARMHVINEQRLVKIVDDKIHVHDLLQEIGREIHQNKPKIEYNNDVFLSFRGEDTRKSFTTHLCSALKQAGIEVFMDEEGIERGENISSSLLQAIESSRISIIIFSKNYAGSSWCLQELEKIMECHKTTGQEVLPIFYNVRPSEVRKQQNAFGKAWKRLIARPSTSKSKESTISLQRALIEAANLSGWDMQNYRTETELIDEIIETILKKLEDNKYLFVACHPVGLKSRVQDIIQLLRSKSNEVIIAGIWGMGGIGKTTIAKAIYNEIGRSFVGKSFLANVREVWEQDNGLVNLQKQLLSCILKTRSIPIPNIEMGKTLIKKMFCQKRVFVVLDDVNNEDQLKALCQSREWFGQGSRIIITTRDKRLLQILQVIDVYNVKEMDHNESLELFSWHAFKQPMPNTDFVELSRMVVSYSGGLPLALEIIGSYLFDRETHYWQSVLKKLQQIPNGQIYEILKISYDGLNDQTEKDIFLDICCFFIGKDRSYATGILDGCGLNAKIGITHLIERSLVKVGNKNKLDMHDLLRDMGRQIIREQSPEEPEKHTRLWFHDDVLDVLKNSTGTIATKGLVLNMPRNSSLSLSTESFKMMKRLRLLQLDHVQLVGNYGYLSKELRWLCCRGFPLENMPADLSLAKIVAIDLKCSDLIKVWEKSQLLEWLKILNLSHSRYLIETPNFSKVPYLEKLVLKDCPSLSMIHPSIGDLKYIVLLNLKDCKGLKNLPRSIYSLKSLKIFNLSGCAKIEKLEEDIAQMESLTVLEANQTAITQVPFSLVRLKRIQYVSLCGFEGSTRNVFPSLVLSWMSPTNHSKSLFQSFGIKPSGIKGLTSHPLFSKVHEKLEARPSTSESSSRKTPALIGLKEQVHMERSKTFMSSLTIHIGEFNNVIDTLLKRISQGWSDGRLNYSLIGDNYPDWLVFENEGSSATFKVPQVVGHCLKGMLLYLTYTSLQDRMASIYPVGVMIKNFTKGTMDFYKQDAATTCANEDRKKMISSLEPGNEVKVKVEFAHKHILKKITIYLVYAEETNSKLSIIE